MRPERQEKKRAQIREAAEALLMEKGYRATSMLQIARRATASNETLYRWYGGKQGLFREMVLENAQKVGAILEEALAGGSDPVETLRRAAPVLLAMVAGESAVALNRAAVADVHETGTLGPTIASAGREAVVPLLARLMDEAMARGEIEKGDPQEVAEVFVSLLIGDTQIRRATEAMGEPGEREVAERAEKAIGYFLRLFGSPARK